MITDRHKTVSTVLLPCNDNSDIILSAIHDILAKPNDTNWYQVC